MKKKTILSIVVLLVIVLGIFGITKFVGAEGNAEGETLVVTHESGETTVNKNPKRVVVFDYGILDSLDKLGVEGIIGVVQDGIPEYLSKYASCLASVKSLIATTSKSLSSSIILKTNLPILPNPLIATFIITIISY